MCGARSERRNKGRGGSWWEPDRYEQDVEELQQLTEELVASELQVAAVHPKVGKEVQRLQNAAQLARLEQSGGRTCNWRREEEQTEVRRVRMIKQLKRELKVQPEVGSGWR